MWLDANSQVQLAIGIKIYKHIGGNVPMLALRYVRGIPGGLPAIANQVLIYLFNVQQIVLRYAP
jgi:hypothetical protein